MISEEEKLTEHIEAISPKGLTSCRLRHGFMRSGEAVRPSGFPRYRLRSSQATLHADKSFVRRA